MGEQHKSNCGDFGEYLQSIMNLKSLEKMTNDLDKDLEDSQNIMKELKEIYGSMSTTAVDRPIKTEEPAENVLRSENISKFLERDVPKLLMPDMVEDKMDIDVDEAISSLNSYADRIKESLVVLKEGTSRPTGMADFDMNQYAQSLDQLTKRLSNIKLNKKYDAKLKNAELEPKLQKFFQDADMFTKLIKSKTTVTDLNNQPPGTNQPSYQMPYDFIVQDLITDINEVIYLLQNKV